MLKSVSILAMGVVMAASSSVAISAPVLSSSANAASAQVSVADTVKANAVFAPVAGTAAPDYADAASLTKIDLSAHIAGDLLLATSAGVHAGIVNTSAVSDYPNSATASADLANVRAGIYTSVLGGIPLAALGISADAITSTTEAGINGAGLFATGSSSIANLMFSGSILGSLGLDAAAFAHALPNTSLSILGLTITFNEQLRNETEDSIFMATNAVHISLDDYLFEGNLLSGDIILGHSQASVTGYVPSAAVPEPSTWALMMTGFGLIGFGLRRQSRARVRAEFA